MNNWKKYKLGEISRDISYGYTESASDECIGPKFLRITDIVGKLDWNTVPYCKIDENNYRKYKLEIGDIVIARTGATTGATEIIKKNIDAVFASYLIRFQIDEKMANPFYIGYVLKSNYWKNFVSSIIGGSAQPGANAKQFANFEISLPDLPTQSRIAQILTSFDDKIELLQQMNQTLETMAQAIFKEWFVASTGSATAPFPEYVEGNLPKGWRRGKLGEVCFVQNGYAFKSNDLKDFGDDSIIKIKNISNKQVDIINTQFVSKTVSEKVDLKFKVESGNILIAMTGAEVGKIGLVPKNNKNLWLNQRVGNFKEKVKFGKWFVFLILVQDEYQSLLFSSASGSAQPNISASQIEDIEITVPNKELIEEFGIMVNPFFEKILENQYQIRTLTQLRDTLLPRLMSGQIKIE